MKIILASFVLLGSMSVLAQAETVRRCSNAIGIKVCADITKVGNSNDVVVISGITPNIQHKRSVAKELCSAAGDIATDYKVEITTKKVCEYYATRGFFAGGEVSACLDFGGISRGTVFQKIKCKAKR